ncbi:hypothetical protein ACFY2K_42695 [Kitasatospora sp. NPDC001309]|uniref:hypothetical protein n=1 Tax=Kitasatospora sp. NPDC001309 TaxID=3364013 RepID=UPI00369DD220
MTRQRAMPAANPVIIAKQPTLQPSGGRGLRIGGTAEESQASGPEAGPDDVVASGRRDVTEPKTSAPARRGRGQRRPAPRAADAVALTVRHDQDEAQEIDFFVLEIREETGRRVDKAEIVRELLRAARQDDRVRKVLVKRLRG